VHGLAHVSWNLDPAKSLAGDRESRGCRAFLRGERVEFGDSADGHAESLLVKDGVMVHVGCHQTTP
jgi:hypothetical protein